MLESQPGVGLTGALGSWAPVRAGSVNRELGRDLAGCQVISMDYPDRWHGFGVFGIKSQLGEDGSTLSPFASSQLAMFLGGWRAGSGASLLLPTVPCGGRQWLGPKKVIGSK